MTSLLGCTLTLSYHKIMIKHPQHEVAMTHNNFQPPASELQEKVVIEMTASERLKQSRKEIEDTRARQILNVVWGLRLVSDVIVLLMMIAAIFQPSTYEYFENDIVPQSILVFVILFFTAEILSIIGYFRKRRWCIIPLHIFSVFSLLNFPIGTIFSIVHFIYARKLQFIKQPQYD